MKPIRKHPMMGLINYSLTDLPASPNLSLMWNFGSMLGLILTSQIITGLLLTMHYSPSIDLAFSSIMHISREVDYGWALRSLHANGASIFFLLLYLHMSRSLYYGSFVMHNTWNAGVSIFILSMATAFMGYLLPWGQMSFWGATVITNLFSAIPYMGSLLVQWIWGGFSVCDATLTRFFALHYLLPFLIAGLALLHLIFLHASGSSNPVGTSPPYKLPFHSYYSIKDIMGFFIIIIMLITLSYYAPSTLSDPENFIPANPLVTPTHIKPEWYFLWAYAILRSIPNKLGGVICMFSALLCFYILPIITPYTQGSSQCWGKQYAMWIFAATVCLLTWIGGCPVEYPYVSIGAFLTFLYFLSLLAVALTNMEWHESYY